MPRCLPAHLRQRQNYSEDLRRRVIYQRFTLDKKVADIACDLDMSRRSVERVLQFWSNTGEVISRQPGKEGKRRRVMDTNEMEASSTVCPRSFS